MAVRRHSDSGATSRQGDNDGRGIVSLTRPGRALDTKGGVIKPFHQRDKVTGQLRSVVNQGLPSTTLQPRSASEEEIVDRLYRRDISPLPALREPEDRLLQRLAGEPLIGNETAAIGYRLLRPE